MNPSPYPKMSPTEFLAFERSSDEKHEYRDGVIVSMTGAKFNHNQICTNLTGILWQHFKEKNCNSFSNDMRVFVPKTRLYTYPDVLVVCGEPQFQDDVPDTLTNPLLLIEILSESTESYDRGQKFQNYRSIDSLNEYVLVSQNSARIEKYVKHGDGFWMLSDAVGMDASITLDSIQCEISLADVYAKVNFEAA